MIKKKDKILFEALKLFAFGSFDSVTTSEIARHAKVSEGLIFKHFKNKKGLFDEIVKESDQKLFDIMTPILIIEDPKAFIKEMIEMPLSIDKSEYDYWRFHFKLKWENQYDASERIAPLIQKMTESFKDLEYKNPDQEAEMLMHTIESISVSMLRDENYDGKKILEFLMSKYL